MTKETFVLGSNVSSEAHRRYYGPAPCPGFWRALQHFAEIGRGLSIDRVDGELQKGGDSLACWAQESR